MGGDEAASRPAGLREKGTDQQTIETARSKASAASNDNHTTTEVENAAQRKHEVPRKASPADSEAETEILAGSQAPTPLKPRAHAHTHVHAHESTDEMSSRKRKASIGSSIGEYQSTRSGHGDDSDESDLEPSNRRRKNVKVGHVLDDFSNYSSARSHSPPRHSSLRSSHQRSSSYSSTLPLGDPGRRLRRRRQASEDQSEQEHTPAPVAAKKGLDHSGRTQLARACNDGDLARVRAILETSTEDLDRSDYANNSPLQMAACNGHLEICQLLIEKGAKVNTLNVDGETPLKDATDNEHEEIVQLLVRNGADTGLVGRKQGAKERLLYGAITSTALLQYIKDGDGEGVMHCLNGGILPSSKHAAAAAQGGHEDILNVLFAFGAEPDPDPDEKGVDGKTPMIAAIEAGQVGVVNQLINKVEVNVRRTVNGQRYAAIARARKKHNWQKIAQLLEEAYRKPHKKASGKDSDEDMDKVSVSEKDKISDREDDKENDQEDAESKAKAELEALRARQAEEREKAAKEAEALKIKQEEEERIRKEKEEEEERIRKENEEKERIRKRAEEEERLRKEAERKAREEAERIEARRVYLASLPRVLAHAMTLGTSFPLRNEGWKLGLQNWSQIYVLRAKDLGDDQGHANQWFMQSWQASMILGHQRLDTISAQISRKLRMTEAHRQMLLSTCHLASDLTEEARWGFAPAAEQAKCDLKIEKLNDHATFVHWGPTSKETKNKILALSDDQLFWVPFVEFNNLVRETPRLKSFSYRTMEPRDTFTTTIFFKGGYPTRSAQQTYAEQEAFSQVGRGGVVQDRGDLVQEITTDSNHRATDPGGIVAPDTKMTHDTTAAESSVNP